MGEQLMASPFKNPTVMEGPPMLRAEGISLGYNGGGLLFYDLNLNLTRGGFIAVVGPSGSGKTTLLKILGGFLRPDSGMVSLNDSPLLKPSPRAVMVLQEFDQPFPRKRG